MKTSAVPVPAVADRPRVLIGRQPNIGEREFVYRCDDALEIDMVDGYEVETKRVFFSDVQLITWHQRYSVLGLWIGGLSLAAGLGLWLLIANTTDDPVAFWIVFWALFVPNIPVMAWFLWPYWHVTVFGRRRVARMRWHFRKTKARAIFESLSRDIRAYQEAHREQEPIAASTVPAGFGPPTIDVAGSPP